MNTRYDTCPNCGGQKRLVSDVCGKCRFSNSRVSSTEAYLPVTNFWVDQFVGLFMGEGSALIVKNRGDTFTVIVSLGLRADDLPVLEDIQAHLGGTIVVSDSASKKNPNAAPAYSWKVTGMEEVEKVCKLIVKHLYIPAKKFFDIQLVLDFCAYRIPRKRKILTDEERSFMRNLYEEGVRARVFKF